MRAYALVGAVVLLVAIGDTGTAVEPRQPRTPRTPEVPQAVSAQPSIERAMDKVRQPQPLTVNRPATPKPTPRPTPKPRSNIGQPWIALADCETGDGDGQPPYSADWDYNGPSGFDGGIQFLPSTWRKAWRVSGRSGPAGYAYQHPAHVQVDVARAWLKVTSWRQWPACSRRIGLR